MLQVGPCETFSVPLEMFKTAALTVTTCLTAFLSYRRVRADRANEARAIQNTLDHIASHKAACEAARNTVHLRGD